MGSYFMIEGDRFRIEAQEIHTLSNQSKLDRAKNLGIKVKFTNTETGKSQYFLIKVLSPNKDFTPTSDSEEKVPLVKALAEQLFLKMKPLTLENPLLKEGVKSKKIDEVRVPLTMSPQKREVNFKQALLMGRFREQERQDLKTLFSGINYEDRVHFTESEMLFIDAVREYGTEEDSQLLIAEANEELDSVANDIYFLYLTLYQPDLLPSVDIEEIIRKAEERELSSLLSEEASLDPDLSGGDVFSIRELTEAETYF